MRHLRRWWAVPGAFAMGALAATVAGTVADAFGQGAPVEAEATRIEGAQPTSSKAVVVQRGEARKLYSPTGKASVAVLAEGRNAFVALLEMEPGATVPEHRDPTEEYVYILDGEGTITIDGATTEVGPGSAVFMPPTSVVSFRNGGARLKALQVLAGPESASKYGSWAEEAPAKQ